MKRFVGFVGILITVAALVFGIGAGLPQSHSVSVTRNFDAPIGQVWVTLTNVEGYPAWRSEVDRVELQPTDTGLRRWTEWGGFESITFEIAGFRPGDSLVVRIVNEDLPFGGQWAYQVREVDGGTELTIQEDGEVYSAFFRFMSRFVIGHDRTIRTFMDDLDQRLSGPTP